MYFIAQKINKNGHRQLIKEDIQLANKHMAKYSACKITN